MDIDDRTMQRKLQFATDLNVLLTVEQIAQEEGRSVEDVLPEFVRSETGKLLYDEKSKLWWSAAPEIADIYHEEVMETTHGSTCEKERQDEYH